ncbi:MAG: addiction module protein [Planctomycetes bacterium]|nr:addiction module protein [Planctomycetota bacterium]
MHPAMNQLSQLPLSERLELVQDLWDSIGNLRDKLPVQDWHRELVQARLNHFENEEQAESLTREEVWKQVDQRRGL